MSKLLSAAELLDREFLGIRSKLIDLAASLDRIQRAGGGTLSGDLRIEKVQEAARILAGQNADRAEQIQILFSLSNSKQS
jgi:hypothetical protein